jgi:hypothetical protein
MNVGDMMFLTKDLGQFEIKKHVIFFYSKLGISKSSTTTTYFK